MNAMFLESVRPVDEAHPPLIHRSCEIPICHENRLLVKVEACGVCHTELDEIEGRTPPPHLPVIPGHQVVGRVVEVGDGCHKWQKGDCVGVGWIFAACGSCAFCLRGDENLCPSFRATGRDAHGGYADYMVVHEDFAISMPGAMAAEEAAPLLCAGAIGYRSLRRSGIIDGQSLGLAGFGASAHLVLKLVRSTLPSTRVLVFARSGGERQLALDLGANWAGDYDDPPPFKIDAIIDTTPAWMPAVRTLQHLEPGGRLVINAIRKENADQSALMHLRYERDLWMEKQIRSVANVTREDIRRFIEIACQHGIRPEARVYPLQDANEALFDMKQGRIRGAKVLVPS